MHEMSCGMLLRPIPDGNKHWNSHRAPVCRPPSALRLGKPVATNISVFLLMPSYNVSFMPRFYVLLCNTSVQCFSLYSSSSLSTIQLRSLCYLHFFCYSEPTCCRFLIANVWAGWKVAVSNRYRDVESTRLSRGDRFCLNQVQTFLLYML